MLDISKTAFESRSRAVASPLGAEEIPPGMTRRLAASSLSQHFVGQCAYERLRVAGAVQLMTEVMAARSYSMQRRLTHVVETRDRILDAAIELFGERGPQATTMNAVARRAEFLLWCFEWELKVWERVATAILPFGDLALRPGEVERWFGSTFDIERIARESDLAQWPRGWAAYLLTSS
jgi:hypothetical protein